MTKRAITYSRVSGDDTKKDGLNLKSQNDMTLKYCQQKDYQVIAQLSESDKGASGVSMDLPQLNKVIDMAASGQFDILVAREIDRLSRDIGKLYILKTELAKYNVTIEYVLADYTSSTGVILEAVTAAIATIERDKIKERTQRAKRNKIKSGSISSSRRPYGYKIVLDNPNNPKTTRSLEIIEGEAAIVRLIFEWYTLGESLRSIARELSKMSIPTMADMGQAIRKDQKMKKYGEWSPSTIHNILSNKTYIGQWQFSPTNPIIVDCPPIIDKATWDKAQAQKEINATRSKRNTKAKYLLSGRVRCYHCNYAMNAKTSRPKCNGKEYAYQYYYEQKDSLKLHNCDNKKLYKTDKIDDLVWQWVVKLMSDPDYLNEKLLEALKKQDEDNSPLLKRLATTKKLIADQESELDDLLVNMRLMKGKRAERAKEAIASDIENVEITINKLELECSKLEEQISQQQRITSDDVKGLVAVARKFQDKLTRIKDFDDKKLIIDMLDMTISLGTVDNQLVVKGDCVISTEFLSNVSQASSFNGRNEQKIILQIGYVLDTKYNIISETL